MSRFVLLYKPKKDPGPGPDHSRNLSDYFECQLFEKLKNFMEVLHCGNRNFRYFGYCDLELDPMTFIYELDPYSLEIYRMCENELHIRPIFRKLSSDSDRQTYRQDRNYISHRLAGGQKRCHSYDMSMDKQRPRP